MRFPWVCVIYCLGQSETNTYFISPCLIGYQMGIRVGAQKHTPPAHLSSTISPFAGRLVGHMQYAPTLPAEKSDLNGWWEVTFGTRGDEYVFHFSMSNRLSDRCPGRGVLHTPLIDSTSTSSPLAGRLVGRMQYAPTLSEKDEVSLGRYFLLSRTMRDQYAFHFFMSNRLSDRYPGRGVLHTSHNHSRKGHLIARQTIVRRMQYDPTLPEKDEVSLGRYYLLSRTMGDKSVFHSSMSNRLSDRYPGRAQKHTPLARLLSTLSSLTGRLMRRKQYAPTLPEKEEVSSGRCFLLSRTIRDKFVFLFSTSNQLSDRYPCRGVLHTPLIDSTSTHSPLAGRLVRRMQYAPTFPEKDKVSSGWCFPSSQTMGDQYVFHFSTSNRLSDRYPGRAQKHTPLNHSRKGYSIVRQTIVGRMQYAPTLPAEKSDLNGW